MNNKDMLKKYEFIVNTSREFMTMINRDYQYEAANKAYCDAHNRKPGDIIGKTVGDIWGEDKVDVIKGYIHECFSGREVHYESWFEFPALGMRCFEVYCYPFKEKGETSHMVVVSRDITERKIMEEKVFVDPLTNLYNFRYFNQRIEEEYERAKRYELNLPLLFADIDNFKDINDRLTHHDGNEILRHIAFILSNSENNREGVSANLRKADVIARFGGEEFVVILPETTKKDGVSIAERIRKTVEVYTFPHYKESPEVKVTISIGVAAFPDDKITSAGDLVKKADLAMYDAKSKGRNRVSTY